MKKSVGQLRHRLTIKTIVEVPDDIGGATRADTSNTPLWGDLQPLSQYQIASALANNQKVTHKIIMRYNDSVKQGCVIVDENSNQYYVESVMNPDMRKRFIEIKARISDKT